MRVLVRRRGRERGVIGIVTASGPQSNVMIPPLRHGGVERGEGAQAGVPVPTTVVGDDVSTSWVSLGSAIGVHEPVGLPGVGNAPLSPAVVGAPAPPVVESGKEVVESGVDVVESGLDAVESGGSGDEVSPPTVASAGLTAAVSAAMLASGAPLADESAVDARPGRRSRSRRCRAPRPLPLRCWDAPRCIQRRRRHRGRPDGIVRAAMPRA